MTELTMERRFTARLADVWAMWTTAQEIEKWWGPNGFGVRVRALDLRVGGVLDYVMVAQDPAMVDYLRADAKCLDHSIAIPPMSVALRSALVPCRAVAVESSA